jgi:hypothetical protein
MTRSKLELNTEMWKYPFMAAEYNEIFSGDQLVKMKLWSSYENGGV